jgi:SpoVK/Ycf46/Vps4 family AAA+-type ATPase
MMATYTRTLAPPERSFCLFGPRGTGKTTWLRQVLTSARWYELHEMLANRVVRRRFGVYLGKSALRDERIDVLPLRAFLQRLNEGSVLG